MSLLLGTLLTDCLSANLNQICLGKERQSVCGREKEEREREFEGISQDMYNNIFPRTIVVSNASFK